MVCNFAPVQHDDYQVGVPFHGKYKEILNSESTIYGGSGVTNPRAKTSKAEECNGREESIKIQLAPLAVQIFTCTPVKEVKTAEPKKSGKSAEAEPVKAETKKAEAVKTEPKKPGTKKEKPEQVKTPVKKSSKAKKADKE